MEMGMFLQRGLPVSQGHGFGATLSNVHHSLSNHLTEQLSCDKMLNDELLIC